MGDLVAGMEIGPMSRQTGGSTLPVEVDAEAGPGGLGAEFTVHVGINSRRASADSMQISAQEARFVRSQVGGVPSSNKGAVIATDPFKRNPGVGNNGGNSGNGSPPPQTEEAIDLGLQYLARIQQPDGSWSLQASDPNAQLVSDTAATGLVLMAFQGAGYNHREHKYASVVRRAIEYLVRNQVKSDDKMKDGDLFTPLDDSSNEAVWLYSHGIAALSLCEAYGMTQDPDLKVPAQKAIDFIVNAQHKGRGGWRYSPQVGSDTSVTGWMMMALKSGDLANLEIPKETYKGIDTWLNKSQMSGAEKFKFRYNPYAPDTETQRHGRDASKTMTSVGLLMRLYSGAGKDDEALVAGAEYLRKNLPAMGTTRRPERDTYYWYYATQVMFHMGGEYWEEWNGRLHPMLIRTQVKQGASAGSWNPRTPVPDRWAPHAGRLYVTTMNLLSLEVYYRHLPLYEETLRGKDAE
jgi:hypothetical protein